MFVSVRDTGLSAVTYEVLSDDGKRVRGGFVKRSDALSALVDMWIATAWRHGLALASGDLRYCHDLNGFTIDGSPVDLWIEVVCGCYEVGGSVGLHVDV